MKKYLLSGIALMCSYLSMAQLPEDILRYSYFPQHGSARNMAIGGAMGSLGGDISALYVNPAGLAFYRTQEFVFSPGLIMNKNKASYLGTDTFAKRNGFYLVISGFVAGFKSDHSKWTNEAFSIGINQTANFNSDVYYKGSNKLSSYSEVFADQFAGSGQTIDGAINNPRFAYGTGLALYTYLVDTFRNAAGNLVVKSLPEFLLERGVALNQEKRIETRGGIYELALGYAANMDDKILLGAAVGIPIVNYERRSMYRESDASGLDSNRFSYFQLNDTVSTKGIGFNLKVGLIYKPKEFIRLGLAVHTPTYYSLTDRQGTGLTTNTENYNGTISAHSLMLNGLEGKSLYTGLTPWRVMASGSYVFREVKDTRKQRAFLTADIEYVNYRGTRFYADGQNVEATDKQYYKDLKDVTKSMYKGSFNYKLGGELKFNTIMVRLGGAYYSSPYQEKAFKSSITQATGGIGYRNHGMFIDLTYSHNWIKEVNFPYRLTGKENYYAMQNNQRGNVMLTFGVKL